MAFGFAGAAAGAAGALRQQQQDAISLEDALAEREYKRQLILSQQEQNQRLAQEADLRRQEFEARQAETARKASDENNARGVRQMVGTLIRQQGITPETRPQIIGTLMEAGRMPTADDLAGPQGADPFTLGPGQIRFDPSGQPIAQGPAPTGDTPDPFTLSPGQIRFGAEGQVVARGAPPQTAASQPRRVLSGDVNRIADLDTSLNDLDVLEQEIGTTGAASKVGAMVPNVVSELTGFGADAKARQGVIDRVKQVIGKALEGGVLRKEDEYKYTKILPTIGDPPQVAQAKLRGLRNAIQQRRATMLDALEDAEFNVENFRTRQRAPSGGQVEEWVRDPQTGKLVRRP